MTVKLTYHQFLAALEAEERNRFIENTSQEILDEFFSSNETKNWLANAFDWYISPEGFDYWRKINDRIFDDENQTATKEVVKEAMEAVSKDVLAPKCVIDGIVNQNQIGEPNKKVSSVEWLYDKLKSHFEHDDDLLESVMFTFAIAKQMHREEMRKSYHQFIMSDYPAFDEYYNETF